MERIIFHFKRIICVSPPKKAIRAAYKYADNVKKVTVVKHSDLDRYELEWKCDEILRKQDWYSRRRRHKVGL